MDELLKISYLRYFIKIDKSVEVSLYDPVSYENWKVLRELEPTKFTKSYESYVKSKKEQYDFEVERRKLCDFEFCTFMYSLHPTDITKTKKKIIEIESDPLFEMWFKSDLITKDKILNYE